ncbi:MAG: CotH kinase family protein [Flavobacteriales bacterium]|nr:hypothetical protein [Flavobacteriales bacterium]MCC6576436.1 CotH kinase family protein [Flavobacteriales bacterium]
MKVRTKRWLAGAAVAVVLLAAAAWGAHRALVHRGHPGLAVFLRQWAVNYPASFAVEPPVIAIEVDEAELARLTDVVRLARERGVIMPDGNEPVEARFTVDGRTFKGRVRIKGKLSDHVQGEKWSFRVLARKDGGFLGMKRFSLQHPGTRNYLCDWFYHRLMAGEGLIALRYGFCRVLFNGEDLGVYAYEEHFEKELAENNGRAAGPLLRFDPGLFWQHRLNGMQGLPLEEAYAAYQAAELDAYGTNDLAADPQGRRLFEEAMALVDAFRRGDLPASAVFDADRTARRLALLDLIGGHHSMDWSDVKFHFDPVLKRLEPVSYESFSAFRIRELAGAYRFRRKVREQDELHTQLLSDPAIMAAYVHHLERYARPAYLDSAFTALKGPLDTASATLYREFPYKELDRSVYRANQRAIRALLDPPKHAHFHHGRRHGDTLEVVAVPIEALPVQVDSLCLADGRRAAPVGEALVLPRPRGGVGRPQVLRFVVGDVTDSALAEATVRAGFLGGTRRKQAPLSPFRVYDLPALDLDALAGPNVERFPFLVRDEARRTISFKPGRWSIAERMVLPAGYTVVALPPLRLEITAGAALVSRSPLRWTGTADMPIVVTSPDSSSRGVLVLEAGGRSELDHVRFEGLTRRQADPQVRADLVLHRAPATITNTVFSGTGAVLLAVSEGELQLRQSTFAGGADQLQAVHAAVRGADLRFLGAADDAVSVHGAGGHFTGLRVEGAAGLGLKATDLAQVQVEDLAMDRCGTGVDAREGASVSVRKGRITAGRVAHAGKDEVRYGPVRIDLQEVTVPEDAGFKTGQGSSIRLNGRAVGSTKAVLGT